MTTGTVAAVAGRQAAAAAGLQTATAGSGNGSARRAGGREIMTGGIVAGTVAGMAAGAGTAAVSAAGRLVEGSAGGGDRDTRTVSGRAWAALRTGGIRTQLCRPSAGRMQHDAVQAHLLALLSFGIDGLRAGLGRRHRPRRQKCGVRIIAVKLSARIAASPLLRIQHHPEFLSKNFPRSFARRYPTGLAQIHAKFYDVA